MTQKRKHGPPGTTESKRLSESEKEISPNISSKLKASSSTSTTRTNRMPWWLVLLLKTVGGGLFVMYVCIPGFIWLNPWIQSKVIFLNMIRWPPMINLSNPSEFGLEGARHMHLKHSDVTLGVWHVLPSSVRENTERLENSTFESSLSNGKPIFLYLHGNTGTRAGWHRVQLYKLLASLDFHVVAIDYRGFGDSTGTPTENGVCEDAIFIYNWIKERKGASPLFLWGHSLGTGITTKVAKTLCNRDDLPVGVVLESPFNNIQDAALSHPLAAPYKYLPGFTWIFLDTIRHNDIHFASDENIADVTSPLLILHAHDDGIVPFELGKRLYDAAKSSRSTEIESLTFVEFKHHHGYGHKHIFKAPELPDIIRKFVTDSIEAFKELP